MTKKERSPKYDKKLELKKNVEFSDLMKLAIKSEQPKDKAAKKKK